MKITLLEQQKKNPRRYNLYIDGKYAFGADEDTIVKFRLVPGKEIASDEIHSLLIETEVGKLMERMYGLFSVRDRSEGEIRTYLKQLSFKKQVKGDEEISGMVQEMLIDRLIEKDLLNDVRFAEAWVNARRRSKSKGKLAIKAELIKKGIDRSVIDQVLNEEHSSTDEKSLAEKALQKKLSSWSSLDGIKKKQKALEFLMRKGFDYDVAKQVVAKCLSSIEEEEIYPE